MMETYIYFLELQGYEREDRRFGIMSKNGIFYKIFHDESWYLVMERKAFSNFCKEEAKEGLLRLNNQFEYITSNELKEFKRLIDNIASYLKDEFGNVFYDTQTYSRNVDLAYTEVDDEQFGYYEVQTSIDLINKKFKQKVMPDKGPDFYSKYISFSSYKEMNESIDYEFDTLVRVDEEDWVGEVFFND